MKRLVLVLFAVGLAAPVFAGGAAAQKPEREVLDADDEFVVEGLCDFDVLLEIEGTIIRTETQGGHVKEIYPSYKTTLTNVDTGESIVVVNPGPWFIEPTREIGTGPWIWGGNPETGEPGLFLLRGRWVIEGEEFTFVGDSVDLCAELAP